LFLRARDIDGVVAQARAGARCWLGTMAVLCASTREDKNKMKKYRLAKCSNAHSLLLQCAFTAANTILFDLKVQSCTLQIHTTTVFIFEL
jgi:hypothetical protein